MPISKEFTAIFEENSIFHIYAKSVGNNLLFYEDADKYQYLNKYFIFLQDYVDTYAYNLLDNHVHFIARIKEQHFIIDYLKTVPKEFLTLTQAKFLEGKCSVNTLIKQQFQRLSVSHTQYINSSYNRKGNLFTRPFKRKLIATEDYLKTVFVYVHANQMHHKLATSFEECKWSSYNEIIETYPTRIARDEVLIIFNGLENFILLHEELAQKYLQHDFD
ncbi:hypothetical protein [Ferruginibacter sp. HRS2-29]|uniref:hypothetical protein n=1 Tax=Ferruginibacter sp. HRS2-29 TaxID=2487334 RepID=UPI0020CC0AC1|nr:hypothetical protein [Ferruginibacter sp. HRS2-29]MCP9750577.1 hypothetical protein [Ferruginibacter sp. HRS2-29]